MENNFHPFGIQHEFLLPTRCPHCANIVSTDELENACVTDSGHDCVSVCCPHCLSRFVSSLQYTHGDPRNQAIIVHEDGIMIGSEQMNTLQCQIDDIQYWLQQEGVHPSFSTSVASSFKRILK